MRVQFQLATIDSALDELKAKTRPHGEIITFPPTGEGGDAESVELEILVASREGIGTLRGAIAGPNISIEEVRRRDAPPPVESMRPPRLTISEAPPPPGQASLSPPTTTHGQVVQEHITDDLRDAGPRTSRPPPPPRTPSFGPSVPAPPRSPEAAVQGREAMPSAPPPPPDPRQQQQRELTLRSVTQTVRVDIRK